MFYCQAYSRRCADIDDMVATFDTITPGQLFPTTRCAQSMVRSLGRWQGCHASLSGGIPAATPTILQHGVPFPECAECGMIYRDAFELISVCRHLA